MSNKLHGARPADEILVAYADGTLNDAERQSVASYLETDAEAQAFVEALRSTADLARQAFDSDGFSTPRADLADLILSGGTGTQQPSNVVTLPSRPRAARSLRDQAMPIAASFVICAGAIGAYLLSENRAAETSVLTLATGPVERGSDVYRLLETQPSYNPLATKPASGNEAHDVIVIASFDDAKGRACREFEATPVGQPDTALLVAVACRSADGEWQVEGTKRIVAGATTPGEVFNPATGQGLSEIDTLMTRLGATPPLSAADEAARLKSGWKR